MSIYFGVHVGVAFGDVLDSTSLASQFDRTAGGGALFSASGAASSESATGFVAGAHVGRNMILNLSYLYVDLGEVSKSATATIANGGSTGTGTVNATADMAFHVARVGLSLRR